MGAWLVQPDHWVSDGEEEGDHDRRLAVASDRVDAGARTPLETGVRLSWDRVQVHQVSEVEGPQERAIARVVRAWGPSVGWPSCRVGVCHHQN